VEHLQNTIQTRLGQVEQRGVPFVQSMEQGKAEPVTSPTKTLGLDAYLYVAMMVLLGSTTAGAAKILTREWPVTLLPVVRYTLSALCLLPFIQWRSGVVGRMIRNDWPLLLLAAALCVPINQAFFLSASRLGPTAHVGIFYATTPLVVLVTAWLTRMERVDLGRLGGVLASVVGIALVGLGSLLDSQSQSAGDGRAVVLADALLIGAVISWGLYVAASKPLVQRHGAIATLAATFLIGGWMCVPMALATRQSWPPLSSFSSLSWLTLLFLAVFATPVSQACQNLAMKRMDASQVANFSNLSPLLTVIWGVVFVAENLSSLFVIGGLLTLGGIVWTGWPRPEAATGDQPATVPSRVEPGLWRASEPEPTVLSEAVP